jgi:hypothetical protein
VLNSFNSISPPQKRLSLAHYWSFSIPDIHTGIQDISAGNK